jgi:hypothetical protein
MRAIGAPLLAAWVPLLSCGSKVAAPVPAPETGLPASVSAAPAPPPEHVDPEPKGSFTDWLRARLPTGGNVVDKGDGKVAVVHTVVAGETALTIAKAYLDVTDVYQAKDLAAEISKHTPNLPVGARVEIPRLLTEPYRTPEEDRLRWPPERALKGVYISGIFAGLFWPETIEKLSARKLNAVVLDGKDYMGPITYPTKVKLAVETGAAKDPPIADLSRAIRYAHTHGVHVIVRISCFHDPWSAKYAPRLSLMSKNGHPFQMGWIDPANAEAQEYMVDLAKEVVDLGADEVQLDYVRFPVQPRGISNAVMPAPDGHRSQAMKAFVKRVHDVTAPQHVPLSLDLFGVTATGESSDIEALGQNIGVVGHEAEALSPMVYPSHYDKGWHGFDVPGNHAEIIGIGTKAALERLKAGKVSGTIIRPWLQASSFKTPAYGPKYISDEINSAETSGAVGWLMWDPQNNYWAVWQALPVVAPPKEKATASP